MRISDIAAWADCEAMAIARPPREARVGVAAWVGTLAHGLLLGVIPAPPDRLRYDATTTAWEQASMQASAIAAEAWRVLDAKGWKIMEAERAVGGADYTGHIDILAWHGATQRTALIDLKTGHNVGAGWLQVGGYLAAEGSSIDWGGILHVRRVVVSREPSGTLELRPAPALATAWGIAKERIDAVTGGAAPLRTPGYHCRNCPANCAVRAIDNP